MTIYPPILIITNYLIGLKADYVSIIKSGVVRKEVVFYLLCTKQQQISCTRKYVIKMLYLILIKMIHRAILFKLKCSNKTLKIQ